MKPENYIGNRSYQIFQEDNEFGVHIWAPDEESITMLESLEMAYKFIVEDVNLRFMDVTIHVR